MPAAGSTSALAVLAAVRLTDLLWAGLVALLVWVLGWLLLAAAERRAERGARPFRIPAPGPVPAPEPEQRAPVVPGVGEAEGIGGILRWLLSETEAESAAFLRLSPGGAERFLVEPRGLEPSAVSSLARAGREALVGGTEGSRGVVTTRWLGSGGSKVLVLRGAVSTAAEDPLRFARFAIEWVGASQEHVKSASVEERIRSLPGVAWAEMNGSGSDELRVLPAENVERTAIRDPVERILAGSGLRVKWIDPADRVGERRARLVAVELDGVGKAAARVHLDWQGQELHGLGYGTQTESGRYEAAALAVADALSPLIAGQVKLEGVSTQTRYGEELVVAVVSVDGQRLVGAVPVRTSDSGAGGARAVLDAVNRRLSLMAGGSGRL